LFVSTGVCAAADCPLANAGISGLYVRSMDQVLRLEPEQIDLATAALIISEYWSDLVHGRRYLSRLDDMAYEIRRRLEQKGLGTSYKAVSVINEYLFDELGFKSVKEASDPNDLFLHTVLDKKRGYCLSLSVLYLALGERLGLELHGVVVPGHFFVRYDDGRVRFNIETTSKGGFAPDEHYMEKFSVPEGRESIYMLNLDEIQTLGCFFNNLGNSYTAIGDTESAQAALEQAVAINPSLSESRVNLGNIYLNRGEVTEALYEYQAALRINPNDPKTRNNLGNAYMQNGWFNEAIGEYTQAIRLDPNFVDPYKNLAGAYIKQDMYSMALSKLRQVIALWPNDASLYVHLGGVYSVMDRCDEAIFQYNKALRIDRNSAEAYYGMALCYNKSGMVAEEIDAYKSALAINPNMAAALANLGNAYFAGKDYDAAIEQYKKAVRIRPDDGTVRYNLGLAYSNKSDYEDAAAQYSKAVEAEPDMAEAYSGLAFVYYKLKKYDLALDHIRTAEDLGIEIDENLLRAIEKKL
jgi:tetratricopeptide (TPR) repeat protein